MPEYVYRAITREGVIVKNRVESGNKQSLVKRLKEGNLTPIDVVQVGYGRKKVNTKKKNVTDIDEIMKTANSSSGVDVDVLGEVIPAIGLQWFLVVLFWQAGLDVL